MIVSSMAPYGASIRRLAQTGTIARKTPWRSTTPSSRIAMPRTSRSRRRCNRWCRGSASPGTSAARCGCSATTPLSATPICGPDRAGARAVALLDRAGLARGRRVALGGQGDRLLARAQERRHALDRAHRRQLTWDHAAGDFAGRCDAPPRCAQRPVRDRAEMGRPRRLSCRRRAARHQVHRARRRLRGRDPRHPEGGSALAGGAPAAPRAQAGLVGGRSLLMLAVLAGWQWQVARTSASARSAR